MSAKEIKAELHERWRGDSITSLCDRIIDYASSLPENQVRMLTFRSFGDAVGKDGVDDELLRALTILVSSRLAAFDARALLVDDDDSEHELSAKELEKARATGVLIHPETGEAVPDFESRVIPFFVPSARLRAGNR